MKSILYTKNVCHNILCIPVKKGSPPYHYITKPLITDMRRNP